MGPPTSWQNTDPAGVRLHQYLDKLFASELFAGSARREKLLRYLVERTLAGQGSQVNEYSVGVDVFHKLPSFDPRSDSVVRTDIARLRQKLRAYYGGPGRDDAIMLQLLPRSYAVSIEYRESPPQPVPPAPRAWWGASSSWPARLAVLMVLAGAAVVGWRAYRVWRPQTISLVVLPFRNFSPDHDGAYLADGITEELTNQFAQWKDVRVMSRTSAFIFKDRDIDIREVGRQLNVDEAIEGSFEKQGDRVRITAQMVRTSDGYHLWSHAYEESASDMMSVQEDIARAITLAVRNLGRSVPATRNFEASVNRDAHDLYLRGCSELMRQTAESTRNAENLFRAAIAKDPDYGAAYYRLAQTEYQELLQGNRILTPADLVTVNAHVERALQLEPGYGEARAFWAAGLYGFGWDWPRADREFRRALEQGAGAVTHSLYGIALATRGRFAESHQQFRMAAAIDPLSSGWKWNEGLAYILEGNWAKAEEMTRLVLDVLPQQSHARLLAIAVARKDCAHADAEADWLRRQHLAASADMRRTLALASACHGDSAQAQRLLAEAAKAGASPDFYLEASVYAVLHRNTEALDRLEQSVNERELPVEQMKYQEFFADLHREPRFLALERRVGLNP